jgi:hypothetical protein
VFCLTLNRTSADPLLISGLPMKMMLLSFEESTQSQLTGPVTLTETK